MLLVTGCVGTAQAEVGSVPPPALVEFQHSKQIFLESDPAARRFQEFFVDFRNAVESGAVKDMYAKDAYLNDSLKEMHGVDAIDNYFRKTLETATVVRVSFQDAAVSGENYYFRWVMDIRAPELNEGQAIRSMGMTHVLFDPEGKVAVHQDYWDAASGLFQYLPVIGSMMGWVKGRL